MVAPGCGRQSHAYQVSATPHRWQGHPATVNGRPQEQFESGEYARIEDLAQDVGSDRTQLARMLRLTSLALDIIEAILRSDLSRRSAAKTDGPDGRRTH